MHPLQERVVAQSSHRHIDHGVGFQCPQHGLAFLSYGSKRKDVESTLCEQGDERVDMLSVALCGEGDARDEGDVLPSLMIETVLAEIIRQLLRRVEIVSVGPVVEDVVEFVDRPFILLVAPFVGSGYMAQASQSVAEVLPAVVFKEFLQQGPVGGLDIMIFREAAALHLFGEHHESLFGPLSQFGELAVGEREPASVEHHGIVIGEVFHLFSLHTLHLDVSAVVAGHDVGLLGSECVDHEYTRGCHIVAVREKSPDGHQGDGSQGRCQFCFTHVAVR